MASHRSLHRGMRANPLPVLLELLSCCNSFLFFSVDSAHRKNGKIALLPLGRMSARNVTNLSVYSHWHSRSPSLLMSVLTAYNYHLTSPSLDCARSCLFYSIIFESTNKTRNLFWGLFFSHTPSVFFRPSPCPSFSPAAKCPLKSN